jgi:proteasome accessory factor B
VQGAVSEDGPAGSFEVPPGTDLRAVTQSLAPAPDGRSAQVLVRQGAGHGLRRHADPAPGADGVDVPAGWDLLDVRHGSTDSLADELLGYGADVVAVAPQDLRDTVVRRLRESVGTQEVAL